MHDVGKIGVPDSVLLKPGPLTAAERRRVQEHAALGAEIVAEALGPEQVEWVRHHHERPDGGDTRTAWAVPSCRLARASWPWPTRSTR